MKIKYVGLKPEETAFSKDTGIVWRQGSSHEIESDVLAKRMLQHPDVFALDDSKPKALDLDSMLAPGTEVPQGDTLLIQMDDDQLRAYAKAKGIKVHHAVKGDKLRAAIFKAEAQ